MTFSEKIDKLMEDNGVKNLRQLANDVNIPYTTLWDYYSNPIRLEKANLTYIKNIAKYLNCTVDYLAYDEVTEPLGNKNSTTLIYKDKNTEVNVLTDTQNLPNEVKADILKQAMEEKQKTILEETEQVLNIKKELENIEKKN